MPKTIQNGGFQNPSGQALTGNLLLILSQDAKSAANPNQVAPIATRIPIAGGNIATTSIYFNDELLPNNTYYTATAYDAAGNKVYGPEIWSLAGAGPLDLGTLTPLLISPDPLFSNPVLQNPSQNQAIVPPSSFVFTTGQMNQPLISNAGSLPFLTDFQSTQGGAGNYATEALSVGIKTPVSNATTLNTQAIGAYAEANVAGKTNGGTNVAAVYGQALCLVTNCHAWGANFLVQDSGGINTDFLVGLELDVNFKGATANTVNGLIVTGASVTLPNIANGISVTMVGGGKWNNAFTTADATANNAFAVGGLCATNSCDSQPFNFTSYNSGATKLTSSLSSSQFGDFVFNPNSGNLVVKKAGSQVAALLFSGNTAARNYTYPDAAGPVPITPNTVISATAPTIAAAGCGGGAASIVVSNGTAAFKVNVGTTPGSACTLTLPAATTGWNCSCNDITTQSTSVFVQKQTGAESTTSVTITNFNDVAVATAFVASDILKCSCLAD